MGALARPVASMLWELRGAWATGRRVALRLERADLERVEGRVDRVAASGSHCVVGGCHVPADRVLAVSWPSRLGDSTHDGAWQTPVPDALAGGYPGQMSLFGCAT